MADCFLCDLYEKRSLPTRIYGESTNCIVVEAFQKDGCKRRMMAVLKKHIDNPTLVETEEVLAVLKREADKMEGNYEIEDYHSGIRHYHRHARF